jgi:hypothetical protein
MLRIHPFVMGHLIGAVMTGAVAGAFINPQAAFIGAVALFGGSLVSCFICQWRPGVEAVAWKLWPVAVLANPAMLAALVFMAVDLDCLVGARRGWDCLAAAMAILVAGLCLMPPVGGLLWRWWKRRRATASA